MRKGKFNWLVVLVIAGIAIYLLGSLSNRQDVASAGVDTRTEMERYVDAYSKYTQAQLDRFEAYQSALSQSDWDAFWAMLVRVTLSTLVILGGYFGFRFAPAVVESYKKRTSVVRTSTGSVVLNYNEDGALVGSSLERFGEKASPAPSDKSWVLAQNGTERVIDNETGKFVDDYADVSDFLHRAIEVSGKEDTDELPSYNKIGCGGARWNRLVNEVLKGFFTVDNRGGGIRTYCSTDEYPTLRTLYVAASRRKLPLPASDNTKRGGKTG